MQTAGKERKWIITGIVYCCKKNLDEKVKHGLQGQEQSAYLQKLPGMRR
jgi:hypothetical protein